MNWLFVLSIEKCVAVAMAMAIALAIVMWQEVFAAWHRG